MTKKKGLNLWRRINDFLWEGKIEQDTPEKIAEALTNQSEVYRILGSSNTVNDPDRKNFKKGDLSGPMFLQYYS